MAGEIHKTEAICLDIRPWSKTSHVVSWLTPVGRVVTLVKGAVRPKSQALGQYDLNYTCELMYYARTKGEIHALREVSPLKLRERLREDYRAEVLAGYFRFLASELTPTGPEAAEWYTTLVEALDGLDTDGGILISTMLTYELKLLELLGLKPEVSEEGGEIALRGERKIVISSAVAKLIANPNSVENNEWGLDAMRAIGAYYAFHVGIGGEIRRTVLNMILKHP